MSVYENGSNFFLLQTENFQPLLELIEQLNAKIEENQTIIDGLTSAVDHGFAYPVIGDAASEPVQAPDASSDTPAAGAAAGATTGSASAGASAGAPKPDILSLFLKDKYSLEQIEIAPQQHDDPRVQALLEDIERLKVLRSTNSLKNKQLYQIVQDYEMFIVNEVLPKMREDIEKFRVDSIADIRVRQVTEKFASEGVVWSNYMLYAKYLDRLIYVCEKLSGLAEGISADDLSVVEQKLVLLNEIKGYMTGVER